MKIFVCEFISGGGLYREPLPPSLAAEGMLMRDALLRDLAALPGVELTNSHDARLPSVPEAMAITVDDDPWRVWHDCIAAADAVWPIAPETGGILLRLTRLIESQHKILLGCGSAAVALTGSKYATWLALRAAGISIVPTWLARDWPADERGQWVAKPDDGVGCEGSLVFASTRALEQWLAQGHGKGHGYIIQPLAPGIAASISMLCRNGEAWLLSCNRQKVQVEAGKFVYSGSIVNGMAQHWVAFEALAQQIARTIPGLSGYIGVDVLVHESSISVLEINPRLTTSYAGLYEAAGLNPAQLVIGLLGGDLHYNHASSFASFSMPEQLLRKVVDVTPILI